MNTLAFVLNDDFIAEVWEKIQYLRRRCGVGWMASLVSHFTQKFSYTAYTTQFC